MRKNKAKIILTILLFMSVFPSLLAENNPSHGDFFWVTRPNHSDWLYKTGEKAVVDVLLLKYGVVVDNVDVNYEISPDMLEPIEKGSAKLKNGEVRIPIGTRKTPGFLQLKLTATVDGLKTTHNVKVGYGVQDIKPFTKMPADFKTFWQQTIENARKTPVTFSRELAPEYCTDKIDCWLVKLRIDSEHYMYGYLTMPKNVQKGSHPVVLCPPGAGIKTIKEPLRHRYYAESGMIRFEVEIHGLDPRWSDSDFKAVTSAFGTKDNGYLTNGIDSRERYYMRHVYAGMVRCIDFLTSLPEWDGRNVAVQGGSQGGALALIAAGLDPRVTLCVANHPALTDMAAYTEKGSTGGYPHFNRNPVGILTPQVVKTLEYYDVINFCRQINCPVRMTWGYNDNTCPPTTSFAAFNVLTCPKTAVITPINEHWTSETMERQHMEWIRERLQ